MHRWSSTLCVALLASCAAPDHVDAGAWTGELEVHGALRAMFHQGATGTAVTLDELLPDPDLVAVGALSGLAGEVTIVDGRAHLSVPTGPTSERTSAVVASDAGAALLVAASVPAWHALVLEREVPFDALDAEVARLAASAGWGPDERFPFVVRGVVADLAWHVIDGTRLDGAGGSHADHLAAAVQLRRERSDAVLVGFHSATDMGVFTHMGSTTHVHAVVRQPLSAGHVDHVRLPAGTTIAFPVRSSRRP